MHRFQIKELGDFVISYDPKVHAAYIRIRQGRVHKTKEQGSGVFVDLNSHGQLLGVEVLDPKQIQVNIVARIAREFNVPVLKNINPRAIPDLYAHA